MDSGRQRQKLIILNAKGTLFVEGYQRKKPKNFGKGFEIHEVTNVRRSDTLRYTNLGYKRHTSVLNGGRHTCRLLKELHAQGHCIVVATEDLDITPYQTALLENGLSFINIYNWKSFATDLAIKFGNGNAAIATDEEAKTTQLKYNDNKFKFYPSINEKFGRNIAFEDIILFDNQFSSQYGGQATDAGYLPDNLRQVDALRSSLEELSRPTDWSWTVSGMFIGFIVGAILTYLFGPIIGIKAGLGIKSALSFNATTAVIGGFFGNEIGKASNYCELAPAPPASTRVSASDAQTPTASALTHRNTLNPLQVDQDPLLNWETDNVMDHDDKEFGSRNASPRTVINSKNASPRENRYNTSRAVAVPGKSRSRSHNLSVSFSSDTFSQEATSAGSVSHRSLLQQHSFKTHEMLNAMRDVTRQSTQLKEEKERRRKKEKAPRFPSLDGMGTPLSTHGRTLSLSSSPNTQSYTPSPTDDEAGLDDSPVRRKESAYTRQFAEKMRAENDAQKYKAQRQRQKNAQARSQTSPFRSTPP